MLYCSADLCACGSVIRIMIMSASVSVGVSGFIFSARHRLVSVEMMTAPVALVLIIRGAGWGAAAGGCAA
jgi:hypothetical protein